MPRRQPSTEETMPTEEPSTTRDYADGGAINDRRLHVSACRVSLNVGTVILVSDSLLFHYLEWILIYLGWYGGYLNS